jgi:GNAT superfamily N-acetyltransferase
MAMTIGVKPSNLDLVMDVHAKIPEFKGAGYDRGVFEQRLKAKHVLLTGFAGKTPAGYLAAYERWEDGSIYCWLTGVDPAFRRHGILTKLMASLEQWAKSHGYQKITIKTRNCRREMLSFLVKNGFQFTHVQTKTKISENRILLEKTL